MAGVEGKRVLVTGSARGIGRAIAEKVLEQGGRVVISDVDTAASATTAKEIGATGTADCDVTDEASVQAAVAAAVDQLGGLDVMVNNAGIEIAGPLLQQSVSQLDRIMAVNVRGVFLGMQAALPHLMTSGGNIVNIASIAGLGGSPLLGTYCASKAAVLQLTRVAAIELRTAGVRVNAVCPGFADTSMVERLIPDFEAAVPVPFADLVAQKQMRLGTAEEIAEVTCFLASDAAAWTTGSSYVLDGGLTASLL